MSNIIDNSTLKEGDKVRIVELHPIDGRNSILKEIKKRDWEYAGWSGYFKSPDFADGNPCYFVIFDGFPKLERI